MLNKHKDYLMMKLNHKGMIDHTLLVALAIVIVAGALLYSRVNNAEISANKSDQSAAVVEDVEVLADHIDTEEAVESVEPISKSPGNESESTSPAESTDTTVDLEEVEQVDESDTAVIKECPVKGAETLITFYPSDYTQLNVRYEGDVSVIKGGSDNCGIMRLAVEDHYSDSARIVMDVNSGMLANTFEFEDGDRFSVCSEVRFVTSNPGYGHDVPENIGFLFMQSEISSDFSVHCSEFTHDSFDNGSSDIREAIILSLSNNAFNPEDGSPTEGGEYQAVDIRRVTIGLLE